ncbi:hypothetical protein [Cohnella sp. CFH 77786]|uniref:hypothetical protein n=1 Tax=Cohnella sp. CFH 77786 TaxID=2662265 RepID=UPI0021079FEC|nr:hypothetical protein [Cohnella sp. CFH 77786]
MTEQAYHTVDVLLKSTYYYFGQLYTNDMEIFNAMYGDEFTGMQSKRIRDKLVDLKAANPLIESVYIYNMNHDRKSAAGEYLFQEGNGFLITMLR